MTRRQLPDWTRAYRLVNSCYPPIGLFEDTLDPADLEVAFAIESLTNDRLRDAVGELPRVPAADRLSGPGTSPVMAAFTHIGHASRFTDGTYGVYYCASSVEAAIAETRFHQERFWAATNEPAIEITLRTYVNQVVQPMLDVRDDQQLHDPDPSGYGVTQAYARQRREEGEWGLLYRSVRLTGHECVAALRPPALTPAVQGPHFRYRWDPHQRRIDMVMQLTAITLPGE